MFGQKVLRSRAARHTALSMSFAPSVTLSAWPLNANEPSYEQAAARWPNRRRTIAFLGWKDYPDEFGVRWNGNLETTTAAITDADRTLFSEKRERTFQVTFSGGDTPRF